MKVFYDYEDKINQAVFPGLQGGPHNHTITGLAVALKQVSLQIFQSFLLSSYEREKKKKNILLNIASWLVCCPK